MNDERVRKLQEQMAAKGIDTVALVPGPNMVYFAKIHAHVSERPIVLLLPAAGDPAVIIPTLEAMKAKAAGIVDNRIFDWNDDEGFACAFEAASAALNLPGSTLGVEALHMRVLESQQLQETVPGLTITGAEAMISALRMIKDDEEIATMDRAVAVAEEAMDMLLPQLRAGMSEKQIAAMLRQALLDSGADDVSFGPIVASGPNSAIPHAVPTERVVQEGELLLFDWGALVDGYASDITRTFAVGEIDAELRNIYELVRQANEAGKTAAAPGIAARDVDRAARTVIDAAGYGPQFFHRTGHGLGLEVHEEPNILESNGQPLQAGNVFTVEPGIYLAGRGGVRIEDDVLVTADGYRSLTTFPRELRVIGSGS
jgi:Xaa-Pro dipeptidase